MAEDINDYTKIKSDEKNFIDLECSDCGEINKVNLSSKIKCKQCDESLTRKVYKSVILSGGLIFGSGNISGPLIDDVININRPSVKVEFRAMVTCMRVYDDEDGCVCAIESLSGVMDALRARSASWREKALYERYNDCVD